jgi:hypothetical protein
MKEYSKKRSAKARPVDVAGGVTVKRSSNARKAQAAPVNTVPTTHALTAAAALPYAHPMSVTPMTVTHHQLQQQGAVPQLLPTFGTSSGSSAGGTFSAVAANAAAGLRASDLVHHSGVPQHQHHRSDNDNDNDSDAESLEQLPEDTVMCGHPSRPHYKTGLCQV